MTYQVVRCIEILSRLTAKATLCLYSREWGKVLFRVLILSGPVFYLPTLWEVWTAENIDAFRTVTWPFLLLGQASSFIILSHDQESDWGLRLCVVAWIIITLLVILAIFCR